MNKTTKAINPDMMYILGQFMFCCVMLLSVMGRDSQSKFVVIIDLLILFFLPISFILIMISYWSHKRKNPEKPLFNVKPKFVTWISFFIGFFSFGIFLINIAGENQFTSLKYLAGLALFMIWLSLFVNSQYRKEDLETEKDPPLDEVQK